MLEDILCGNNPKETEYKILIRALYNKPMVN